MISARLLKSLSVNLLALSLASAAYSDSDPLPWGRTVIGISFQCDARLTQDQFATQIKQKVGEPLDRSKVSESLKNLYATGRFQDLRAEVEEKPQGIVLIFVSRAQYFVGLVTVEGEPKAIEAPRLLSAARLRLGEPVFDQSLNSARQRIAAVLSADGFYQAHVDSGVTPHPEDQVADITFSILPGKPARLSAVEFQGHPGLPTTELAHRARWRVGSHLTAERLNSGLLRIHDLYVKLGLLEATATVQRRDYDPATNTERLVVQAEEGQKVQVHLRGAKLSERKLKKILTAYREGATDELALSQGERDLENYFEEKGYFSAKAKVERTSSPDSRTLDITYTVTPGPRGDFVGLTFKGNRSVSADDLTAVMQLQPRDFPRLRGTFSHALLDHDVKALTLLYQERGFPNARVTPDIHENYAGNPRELFVTFNITEGPLVKVGRLDIQGWTPELQRGLRILLLSRAGQPFSPERAQTDKDSLLTYLANQGYGQATVNWKASPVSPTNEVTVEYTIDTGPRETVQRIIFLGNEHTRDALIDRELTFDEGEPLSQSKLLESQQSLYDLGVFNQVQVAPQNPEGPETEKTVLVRVEEAKRWTVQYGAGVDIQSIGSNQPQGQLKASPRGSLEISRLNVLGRAQIFSARGRVSNLETGGDASYLIPRFARRRDLNLSIAGSDYRTRDVATFTAKRLEGNLTLTRQSSRSRFLSGRFSYRRVEALNISSNISPSQIPLLSQPVRIAMFSATYGNDHRDNPADATRGSYSLVETGVATSRLGSQANFLRLSGQNSTYYRLKPHLIFARNTRIGLETPFGGLQRLTTSSGVVFTHQIPLPERFFMGGSESHRGFGLNQAGPRDADTGFPIGGNAQLLNSFELRAPFGNNRFGFVFFHDMGNVYSSIRTVRLLKFSQSSPTDFDYTVHAVGVGFRYQTPVGPVRFDIAYSANPPRFRVCTQSPQTLCSVTGQGFDIQRLPKIQFFISVGQSF